MNLKDSIDLDVSYVIRDKIWEGIHSRLSIEMHPGICHSANKFLFAPVYNSIFRAMRLCLKRSVQTYEIIHTDSK